MKLAGGLLALVVKYLYIAQLKKRLGVHGIPVSSATLTLGLQSCPLTGSNPERGKFERFPVTRIRRNHSGQT